VLAMLLIGEEAVEVLDSPRPPASSPPPGLPNLQQRVP
jgi:hypothetical protein